MKVFKNYRQLFAIAAAVLFFTLIPGRCIAQSMSEAESRVAREKLVAEAKKYIGAPYIRGATGPDSFDCSGLVYTCAHDSISYQLPRTVKAMYSRVRIVPDAQREPGDLVFFRTTGDGTISHVGLYIGNGQFISAVSDGPNTGVIVSSLKENYWKGKYASCGKFLPDAGMGTIPVSTEKKAEKSEKAKTKKTTAKKEKSEKSPDLLKNNDLTYSGEGSFADRLAFAAYSTADWSIFTERKFMPNFRGLSSEADIIYRGKQLSPALGMIVRWNYGVKAFQMPVVASLYVGNFFRAYAGPLFSFGNSTLPDSDKINKSVADQLGEKLGTRKSDDSIKAAIFPGVIGFTFAFPSFTKGDFKVQIVQDICYSVYNKEDNSALLPLQAASAGLEFCTGVRVLFPMSVFTKK